jgi:hypothetical protein
MGFIRSMSSELLRKRASRVRIGMSVSKSQPFDESRGAGAHFLARFAEASVSEPNTSPVHKLCRRGLVIVLGR